MLNCLFDTQYCLLICKNCVHKQHNSIITDIVKCSIQIIRQIIKVRYCEFKAIEICKTKFVRIYLACLLDRIRLFKIYTNEYKAEIAPVEYTPVAYIEHNKYNLLKSLQELSLTLLAIADIKPYLLKELSDIYNLDIDLNNLFCNLNKPIKISFQIKPDPHDQTTLIGLTISNCNMSEYPLWLKELLQDVCYSKDQHSYVYLRPVPSDAVKTGWPYNLLEIDFNNANISI